MMPLSMIHESEVRYIKKIGGSEETKRFLGNLGFTVGEMVTVITKINSNVIVKVKEARVAISSEMASKIMV
ncbi:MAG: FeoA family protein [Bacillota bacterium]